MARVPILHVGQNLIASVQEELHDRDALQLQEELAGAIQRTDARGVLLDISIVETVDSFLGRMIGDVASSARLLGANTVVVGMQPAVAITLVELGLELKGVYTALNAQKGLALLDALVKQEAGRGVRG